MLQITAVISRETNGTDCERTHYKSLQSSSAETADELVTNRCSHRPSGDWGEQSRQRTNSLQITAVLDSVSESLDTAPSGSRQEWQLCSENPSVPSGLSCAMPAAAKREKRGPICPGMHVHGPVQDFITEDESSSSA